VQRIRFVGREINTTLQRPGGWTLAESSGSVHTGKNERVDADSFSAQLKPLLVLTSIFGVNFAARIIYAPLMPEIEKYLNISHGEAGSLFLLISIGYFMSLAGSGWVAARLTHRKTITLSSMVVGLALIGAAFSNSLWTMRLSLLILGIAAGLYLPSGIATLMDSVSARNWGKAIAVHELAPNLAFAASPLVSELVLVWFSWQTVVVLFGIAALLMGLVFARFGSGGDFPGVAPSFESFKPFLRQPAFWLMLFLFGLGISGTLGTFTMLPLYLVNDHGIERNIANSLTAFSKIPGLGMAFVGGWFTDRIGAKTTLTYVFLLTGITTILMGVTSAPWVIVVLFVQAMLAVCFFPAGFAALSRIGPSNARNIAVSLTVPFAFLFGGGAVPTAIGFMGDVASFSLGITLLGVFIVSGALLSLFLKFQGGADGSENI
jgi:NNP family nitrate/nitrite transporter-like MFS transporter